MLNSPERVSQDLQEAVHRAIEETGYRPSSMARSLALQRTGLIAFRVGDGMRNEASLLDPFMREVARVGARRDYRLVLNAVADDDSSQIESYRALMASNSVDGVIIVETHPDDKRAQWLTENGVPFVAFGRPWGETSSEHSWVDVDARLGIRQAVEHLHANGHERIGYLGSPPDGGRREDRRDAWRDAMLEVSGRVTVDDVEALYFETDLPADDKKLDDFLRSTEATAVIGQDDRFASQAVRSAVRIGLKPGKDFAAVGFDDSLIATDAQPPISSIAQPLTEAATLVWDALLSQIGGDEEAPLQVLIPPKLVVRGSSDFKLNQSGT
ncbi:LacI family transcriptional regulator [Actinomycetaceae bacterium WB03_NA08]|uniref:LacI family transcriptional regulator n=1 Tax=Scrofimicrobium canadense TaxID=2652290 RepID=A0A6N7VUH7_9ACTO|nr:LacI family transcriptional regulator [Scrofimicrobium canadense]